MPTSSSSSTPAPGTVPTVAALPRPSSSQPQPHPDSCPAFPNEESRDSYATLIAPRRELVCPITQEPYHDPVIAEDGHTYERQSILRWFHLGRTRSPVTNEYMAGRRLVPNRAVGGMALGHREKLGRELLRRCAYIDRTGGVCEDGGARIDLLLDAGADPTLRDSSAAGSGSSDGKSGSGGGGQQGGGRTCLHHLINSGRIDLVNTVLGHDAAPVLLVTDDDGQTPADAAAKMTLNAPNHEPRAGYGNAADWSDLADELRRRTDVEKERLKARERARARSNEEHRERQRELAREAREAAAAGRNGAAGGNHAVNVAGGLGRLEEGWGYFPALAALQFQGSVPPPSPSVADWERREKRRLDVVLRTVAAVVVVYLVLC